MTPELLCCASAEVYGEQLIGGLGNEHRGWGQGRERVSERLRWLTGSLGEGKERQVPGGRQAKDWGEWVGTYLYNHF